MTNDLGEFLIIDDERWAHLCADTLHRTDPRYDDLEARGLLTPTGPTGGLADAVRRTRKSFLFEGPSLHIFVVTLRCNHSCQYCQVSRASLSATHKDMTPAIARAALDVVFQSDAPALTIEFQGGEPALRFDLVALIVTEATALADKSGRQLRFTMATTLQLLSDEDLEFCAKHNIHLSTSIDGPRDLHAAQRVLPHEDSWLRTIQSLDRARKIVGIDGVAALPTITRKALRSPEAIVDTYVELGFRSIFLRPVMPYGFASKTQKALGYTTAEFLDFYQRALDHILLLNRQGIQIEETNAAIALRHILTPFHSGYMDLRSPASAGLGTLVYNYDGTVYPSDEARMAAETGDDRFALGGIEQSLDALLSSPAMRWLAKGAVAESHSDCGQCAFVPYCGADPIYHAMAQGEPDAARWGSAFCDRHMALFHLLFGRIAERDNDTMKTFSAWAFGADREHCEPGWIEQ